MDWITGENSEFLLYSIAAKNPERSIKNH